MTAFIVAGLILCHHALSWCHCQALEGYGVVGFFSHNGIQWAYPQTTQPRVALGDAWLRSMHSRRSSYGSSRARYTRAVREAMRQLAQRVCPERQELVEEGVLMAAIQALEAAQHDIFTLECAINELKKRQLLRMIKERTETDMDILYQCLCSRYLDGSLPVTVVRASSYYASLFHGADVPFVLLSRTGVFLDMNTQFLRQWGDIHVARLVFDRLLDSTSLRRTMEALVCNPDSCFCVSIWISRGECVVDLSLLVWIVPLATTLPQGTDVVSQIEPCVCMLQIM